MNNTENESLPRRKEIRIKDYDYSSSGAYFVTICIEGRKELLSKIVSVGDGAFDVPLVELTPIGKIVEKYLLSSENINGVSIDYYVIMPDHIHCIIILDEDEYENGTSRAPSPTNKMLPHIVSVFKRFCNKEIGYNIFQRSFMEHIIRNKEDYEIVKKYIYENPIKWYYDKLSEE